MRRKEGRVLWKKQCVPSSGVTWPQGHKKGELWVTGEARNCRLRLPWGLRVRLRLCLYLYPTKLATAASASLPVATLVPGQSSVSGVRQAGLASTDFNTGAYRTAKAGGGCCGTMMAAGLPWSTEHPPGLAGWGPVHAPDGGSGVRRPEVKT